MGAIQAQAPAATRGGGYHGEWESDWAPAWVHVGVELLPWLLGLVLAALVVRALARQRRYRAVAVLGEREQAEVHTALAAAEARTVGEILPVVVERSDPHPGAKWLAATVTLGIGTLCAAPVLPWHLPPWLVACQLALGAVGYALARALPDFQRLFVPETRASAVCEEQAFQEFYREGLHRTRAATGVLVFVSLLERRVVVLADEGIAAKVEPETWARVDAAVLEGIRGGSLKEGLLRGIALTGDVLAEHFPRAADDTNELPDRLIVRRE